LTVIPTIYLFQNPLMELFLKLTTRCNMIITIIIEVDNVSFIHDIIVSLLLLLFVVIKFITIFIYLEFELKLIVVVSI